MIPVFRDSLTWLLVVMTLTSGCGRLVYKPNPQAAAPAGQPLQQQQLQQTQQLALQNQEYQTRAQSLDKDNQELEKLLAQSRQQVQLLTDEVNATRDQLRTTTEQLLALRDDNQQLQSRTTALVASAQQRAGAEIRANNSLLKNLTLNEIPWRRRSAKTAMSSEPR